MKSGYIQKKTRLKSINIPIFPSKKPNCIVLALFVENFGNPFVRNSFYEYLYCILTSNPLKWPIQQYLLLQAFQLILVESVREFVQKLKKGIKMGKNVTDVFFI